MAPSVDESQSNDARAPAVLIAGAALLGAVAYLTTPGMGHFEGALIPWPAHGIALALVMAAPSRHRLTVVAACAVAMLVGLTPATMAGVGGPARLLAAVSLLVGHAVLITLLHERLAGGRSALSGTVAYAWMLVAVFVGTLPLTLLASVAMDFSGADVAIGFTGTQWWIGATTSGVALVGVTMALVRRPHGGPTPDTAGTPEFVVGLLLYAVALAAAFSDAGPLAGRITPGLAVLPFLVWAGLRFGVRGYAVTGALLVVWVLAATWWGVGPFGALDADRLARFQRAWIYLASVVGTAMIFPVALEERAEADRRTRSALAQLRAMFEGTSDLIAAIDRDLTIIAANSAWLASFEQLTGTRVRIGMTLADAYRDLTVDGPTSIALWRRALAGEQFTVARGIGDMSRRRDEFEITYTPVRDDAGEVVGASQVVRNITEQRNREAVEAEARRLESVGRLAGGVAHDFNNLMTAVMGYGELVFSSLDAGDPRRSDVAEIQRAAARAGELTQQLLAFARRREVRPRIVDVAAQLEGLDRLISSLVAPLVRIEYAVAPDLPAVLIDPTQFEQVVMNLAVNARDAMPDGGVFRIEAAVDRRVTPPGLRLSVRDSGTGMTPEVLARMYEPFYTTKPLGKGTGLGLATVYGIIQQAKGRIEVESTVGVGTTFHLLLPAAPTPDDAPTRAPAVTPRSAPRTP